MFRTMLRSAPLAFALVFAAPQLALAEGNTPKSTSAPKRGEKADRKGKDQHFPMKAEAFKKHVEKRITGARAKLDKALEEHKVPEAMRTQIKKDFEAGATAVRAAAARVSADDVVTKEEAKEVRGLAKDMKKKARDKYRGSLAQGGNTKPAKS